MEKARSRARTDEGPDGGPATVDYRKLSNGELHRILSVVDPRMSSFAVTDGTRETAIAMLDFTRTGR
jgi:hypothetical protein